MFAFRYNLAETIDGQLKRMSEDLREVIDHVNASSASGDTASPVRCTFSCMCMLVLQPGW